MLQIYDMQSMYCGAFVPTDKEIQIHQKKIIFQNLTNITLRIIIRYIYV